MKLAVYDSISSASRKIVGLSGMFKVMHYSTSFSRCDTDGRAAVCGERVYFVACGIRLRDAWVKAKMHVLEFLEYGWHMDARLLWYRF